MSIKPNIFVLMIGIDVCCFIKAANNKGIKILLVVLIKG